MRSDPQALEARVRALEAQLAAATEEAALARGRAERAEARGANAETLEPLLEETAAGRGAGGRDAACPASTGGGTRRENRP